MDEPTRAMKVINGKSVVLTMPSIIAIVVIIVGAMAAYFTTYSDLRADVISQGEKIKSQEKYFEKEFERVNKKLDDIERLLRNGK